LSRRAIYPKGYTDPDGRKVRNRTGDFIVVVPEHGYMLLAPKGIPNEDGDGETDGNFYGRLDGVITPDGKIYKGMGGAKVTKNEDGSYNIKVTAIGKIVNSVANFIKWIRNISKTPEEKEEYYGMYHKDDGSETAGQWWPQAEAIFNEKQNQTDINLDREEER
jgi:hypothetical protein